MFHWRGDQGHWTNDALDRNYLPPAGTTGIECAWVYTPSGADSGPDVSDFKMYARLKDASGTFGDWYDQNAEWPVYAGGADSFDIGTDSATCHQTMGAHFGHAGDGVVGYGDMNGPYLRDIALWNNALTRTVRSAFPQSVITAITQLGADIDGGRRTTTAGGRLQ